MRAFLRAVNRLNRALAGAAGLLTAVIMVIVCADVASRAFANQSIQGASESAILLMVALVFLGFAGAEAKGDNFTVRLLIDKLSPSRQRLLKVVTSAISLIAMALVAWLSWKSGVNATISDERSYGVIAFPIWPSRLIIALGFSLLALQLLANLLQAAIADEDGESS